MAREFRLRYRRALFGWLWAIALPLTRLAILAFVFTRIVPLNIPDYPVFLFTGLIAWMWFSSGVASATTSAVDRRDLLMRPGLPRAAVPVVSVLTDGLDYLAALPVLAAFLMLHGGIPLSAVALPLIVGLQLLLMLGIGFATCSANVRFRDVRLFVEVVLLLGFYVTPVFYSATAVPARFQVLIQVNPVARLLNAYRDVLIEGRLPRAQPLLALALMCSAVFVAGYAIYSIASPTFVDEL
ncbi:MAG: ABC transporter permease [Acidimicrobiales bacterium]